MSLWSFINNLRENFFSLISTFSSILNKLAKDGIRRIDVNAILIIPMLLGNIKNADKKPIKEYKKLKKKSRVFERTRSD